MGYVRPTSATSETIEVEVSLKVWTFCIALLGDPHRLIGRMQPPRPLRPIFTEGLLDVLHGERGWAGFASFPPEALQ